MPIILQATTVQVMELRCLALEMKMTFLSVDKVILIVEATVVFVLHVEVTSL